jgi:hypothetical protein
LVIDPGRTVDLERWIKNGNLSEGNRFKFIERTGAVEQHRGIGLEDGLVRVEYQFEIPRPIINTSWIQASGSTGFPNSATYSSTSYNVNGIMRGVDFSKGEAMKASAASATNATLNSMGISASGSTHDGMATMDWMPANDVGITVPGSKSTQSFQHTNVGALDPVVHNIVLKLVGDLGNNKPVEKPVTVKHKPKCVTCGKQNKAQAKFCSECGTALEIFA